MELKNKRILVTGGAGFIGSHLVDALIDLGAYVTVFDNLTTGRRENVNPQALLVEGDLRYMQSLVPAIGGNEVIFHCAAHADIKNNLREPKEVLVQNVMATANLLHVARNCNVEHISFMSSSAVYGAAINLTTEYESFPIQNSIYGASKVAAEGLLTAYVSACEDMSVNIFRLTSILGPRYHHGHIADFARQLRDDPTKLVILGNGRQRKSYLHVADAVRAIIMGTTIFRDRIGIYNVGHHETMTVLESAAIIARALGASPSISVGSSNRGWPGDSPFVRLDTTRIAELGWKPTVSIADAIKASIPGKLPPPISSSIHSPAPGRWE